MIALVALRSTPQAAAATTRTATVRSGTVTATVTGSGNVASAAAVAVNFPTGGTVTSVAVKAGQKVRKGQKLAVAQAQQQLDQARNQLSQQELTQQQDAAGATPAQPAQASAGVRSAQVQVDQAQQTSTRRP